MRHTGFKGAWLASFLIDQGAEVYGVGLEVNEANSAYCQNAVSERIEILISTRTIEKYAMILRDGFGSSANGYRLLRTLPVLF